MALKTKDIRAMGQEDRAKALLENRSELMHERGLAAMGGAVKNPGRIRDLRTSIARILTLQRQEQLAAQQRRAPRPAPAAKAPAKPAPKAKAAPKAPAKPPAKAPAKAKAGKTTAPKGGPR
jgi:large subunit ribosomal protein L29